VSQASFREAAAETAVPEKEKRRKRKRTGRDGGRVNVARSIVDSYLKLCRDPRQNIKAWLSQDRYDTAHKILTRDIHHSHDQITIPDLADDQGQLHHHALPELRVRLDAPRPQERAIGSTGTAINRVSAGSRAGQIRNDGLRSILRTGRTAEPTRTPRTILKSVLFAEEKIAQFRNMLARFTLREATKNSQTPNRGVEQNRNHHTKPRRPGLH
jgi:hypothetical protein